MNRKLSKVILPGEQTQLIELGKPHFTEYGLWLLRDYEPIAGGTGDIGDAVELKILDHIVGNSTYGAVTPYLGLWTSAVTTASTAATSGELTYTTYARQAVSSTNMAPAASGSVTNDVAITFPAVASGGGTVTFWMLCSSSSGAGDNVAWGSATSTVISTTQTPPTVAISGLTITLE